MKAVFCLLFLILIVLSPVRVDASEDCVTNDTECTIICDNNADHVDFNTAIGKVTSGAVVHVAAGTCDISGEVTVNKALTLSGEDYENSIMSINVAASGNGFVINPANPATEIVEIEGMSFDSTGHVVDGAKSLYILSGLHYKIHDNRFTQCHDCIMTGGYTEGVIYNNMFSDFELAVRISGGNSDNDASWLREIKAGIASDGHSNYIEGNTFILTQDFPTNDCGAGCYGNSEQAIYHQQGGRSVTRYNTFDYTNVKNYTNNGFSVYDSHGNWGGADHLDNRGQPIIEIYDNDFILPTAGTRTFAFRSGSILFHTNKITTANLSTPPIELWEEETWSSGGPFCPSCPVYEAPSANDQITNSFFWNNDLNGGDITVSIHSSNIPGFLILNQDYFLHEPQSSGGKVSWTGDAGLASSYSWSSSGANEYYPYAPYICPHPLTGLTGSCSSEITGVNGYDSDIIAPDKPTGLSVN